MRLKMNRYFRYFMFLVCAVQLFFAAAFLLQMPFAVQLWPLPNTTPLSFIFLSSIFAAAQPNRSKRSLR